MNKIVKNIQRNFEKNYVKIMKWKHIPGTEKELVYVDIKRYKGKPIKLGECRVNPGDTIAEMHIDNLHIDRIDNSLKSITKNYKEEMACLIDACNTHEDFKDIKAVYGISVLHPLLKFLGFVCFPIKNPIYRGYLKWWENMLRNSFSTGAQQKGKKNEPMVCWATIDKLSEKIRT